MQRWGNSLSSQAALQSTQALQLDSLMAIPKAHLQADLLFRGRLQAVQTPCPLLRPSEEELLFSASASSFRTFPQEMSSYVSRNLTHWWTEYPRISSMGLPPLTVNPKSTLLWGMVAWNLSQPTSLSSQQHFGAFLDPEPFKNLFI